MPGAEGTYGTLYLLPVWLGDAGGVDHLPPMNIAIVERITLYFTEHEKTARRMLRRMVPGIDLPNLEMHRLDKDTSDREATDLLRAMLNGRDAAILSEAGMPGIADPGAKLVMAAHRSGIEVVALTGPSSLFPALAASGLNGNRSLRIPRGPCRTPGWWPTSPATGTWISWEWRWEARPGC